MLTIKDLEEHCKMQLEKLPNGSKMYEEHLLTLNIIEMLEQKDKQIQLFENECRKFKAFCKRIRKNNKHNIDLFNQGQEHKCNQFLNLISGESHWDYEGKYFEETDKEIEKLLKAKGE